MLRRLAVSGGAGELHEGHTSESLENVQALVHLANLHREEYRLVSQMTRVAMAGIAIPATWQFLQKEESNEEQLADCKNRGKQLTCWTEWSERWKASARFCRRR